MSKAIGMCNITIFIKVNPKMKKKPIKNFKTVRAESSIRGGLLLRAKSHTTVQGMYP